MIRLQNIKKVYDKDKVITKAINGMDLIIEEGEMVAITGTSGSGKSTLLNIIGMIDTATEGEYYLDDINVTSMSVGKRDLLRNERISFIFQNFALIPDFTIYENIEIPLVAKKIKKTERKKIILETAKKLGIEDILKKYPNRISGGQQQRCAIARAIVSGNRIILADEPTGALDSHNSSSIVDELVKMNNEGYTLIIVTHDINVAKKCKRIVNIKDGKIEEN